MLNEGYGRGYKAGCELSDYQPGGISWGGFHDGDAGTVIRPGILPLRAEVLAYIMV
jgi:hypothetical protein